MHIRILSKCLVCDLLKVLLTERLSSQEVQIPAGGQVITDSLVSSLYLSGPCDSTGS